MSSLNVVLKINRGPVVNEDHNSPHRIKSLKALVVEKLC